MDAEKTGKLIRQLRSEKGMTQQALAEKVHVTATAISKWENAHSLPDVSALEEISAALDISLAELITGEHAVPEITENSTAQHKDTDMILKSVIKESIVQRNRKIIKAVAMTILAAAIFMAGTYLLIIRGLPARQSDITESHGITHDMTDNSTAWETQISSVDGHGIWVKTEYGKDTVRLYVYRSVRKDANADSFTWGYSIPDDAETSLTDYEVSIIYRDQTITYHLSEEGLFD